MIDDLDARVRGTVALMLLVLAFLVGATLIVVHVVDTLARLPRLLP